MKQKLAKNRTRRTSPQQALRAIAILVASLMLFASAHAVAQPSKKQADKKNATKKTAPDMSRSREAAALAFVEEHHEELQELLIHLKENKPQQYQAALRDLHRTSERLATLQEKDPQKHLLELVRWKLKSRGQLLAARLLMSPEDTQVRSQLKKVMLQQYDNQRELLILDRDRAEQRAKRLQAQIDKLDDSAEKMVDRQIKTLVDPPKKTSDTNKKSG